jgi:DNA ligase-1
MSLQSIHFNVMHAKSFDITKDYTGWLASSKMDGYRAIWNGHNLYTRNGILYVTPVHFTRQFPRGIALDGELCIPGFDFESHSKLLRKEANSPVWKVVEFHVFAMPNSTLPFSAVVRTLRQYHNRGPIRVLRQTTVRNNFHVKSLFDAIIADGGEGIMLRNPESIYVDGRTSDLVKLKQLYTATAVIVAYSQGKGRNSNRIGAYVCRFVIADGKSRQSSDDDRNLNETFHIGALSDAMRDTPLAIGTNITVQYQNLTRYKLPRFPHMLLL